MLNPVAADRNDPVRETEFRHSLADRISDDSVASYVAYCRRVERELRLDLDVCDLTDGGIAVIGDLLRRAGLPDKSRKVLRPPELAISYGVTARP